MKKLIAALLALVVLASAFVSCSQEQASSNETTAATGDTAPLGGEGAETESPSGETDRSKAKDNLPSNLDFDGLKVRIIHRDDGLELSSEFSAEETGEIVSEAIYRRNLSVEERLNVEIETIPITSTIHSGSHVSDVVRKSVLAGTDDYDIMGNHMSQSTQLILESMFLNLAKLDYLDFDQPWWSVDFTRQITINGKRYMMAGDAGLSMVQSMYLIYYNKNLFDNFFGEDLYDKVWSGGWTLDALMSYGRDIYTDVNGDSTPDVGDIYGYATTKIRMIDALLVGSDIKLTERGSDGIPQIVVADNERTYSFVEKVNSLLSLDNITWHVQNSADGEIEMLNKFAEGTVLFIPFTPMGAAQLRDMSDDFGVIPMPKLNEEQEEYSTSVHNGFSALMIPATCKEPDKIAAVLEALCAESYRTVTPAYYEQALKIKYSRDDETSRMLDMIRESIKFDFGYINNTSLNTIMTTFRSLVTADTGAVASTLASVVDAAKIRLESLLEAYEELE